MNFLKRHAVILVLCAAAALLAMLPVLNAATVIGSDWKGVPQSYGDEILYTNQIHEVADGYGWFGNQYLYEHRNGPPVVLFAGHWLAAIPLLLGVPLMPALVVNFAVWSVIFVLLGYLLFREFSLSKWLSASGAFGAYLTVYGLVFRPSSRQEVYPFFILFYIALIRFLKRPAEKSSIVFLGLATGVTFYIFSYLWQAATVTLGLVFLYALLRREYVLLRSTLLASALGGLVGLPALLYMLYLSKTVPYFLESLSRFGLVRTHLPMGEVIYSGGWIGILLAALALVLWRIKPLRAHYEFVLLAVFAASTGLGLWIMQGSNLLTGQLLETGEHIRPFIAPWLVFAGVPLCTYLWSRRAALSLLVRGLCAAAGIAVLIGCLISVRVYLYPFIDVAPNRTAWVEQQGYAAPLEWLDAAEKEPVVVWVDPNDYLDLHVPSLSKHYVLYAQPALFTLASNDELHERYLVANYFNDVTETYLKENLPMYVGRQDAFHRAKTVERGIKLCRILHFYDGGKDCGTPPTSVELLGEPFFAGLAQQFTQDIRPHIKDYLRKYHVSYIIKDTKLEPQMKPESLGAVSVWSNGRYEIYRFID